ncbi:FUSC family protein [Nocardioides sp. zg-DK7169]|uniref:FUSC family protein n=1 Tax=Nocardioides sp. zg-DK7169 TaxID=2736600 RepID=UPI001556D498|nr:FUSC family protein [Nocardioides sp. zg-DK7169]NPC96664.1 hypothetical protein [Nocardioides sp. zg-DK7169]
MEDFWLLLGIVVLAATLLDLFLTALNFDEAGFIAGRVTRGQWTVVRRFTRRMSRRWRPVALRQVTGLQIVAVITTWLFGIITGFGLIYYGLMSRAAFSVSGTDAGLTLFDALYFSAAQLSTVGGSSLTAETDLLRFLSIAETLSGVILVSLILTFLLGVYSVIGDLNSLCRYFFTTERGAGSPTASLAPFFHDGQPDGLDSHLDGIAGSFASYVDGLRLHHAAYYFQSGRDQFALPYAVRMLAGTLSALRWGLPTGHPASTDPGLVPLSFQLLEFGEYVDRTTPARSLAVPEVVTRERFEQIARDRGRAGEDRWVARFVELDAAMASLAQVEPLADGDDAYRRYSSWLPFAFRAERITLALSDDLDYQPVIVTDRPVSILEPADAVALGAVQGGDGPPLRLPGPPGGTARPWPMRWEAFVARYLSRTDPGNARLRAAARAVLSAVTAGALLFLVLDVIDHAKVEPAIFGGFVAMLAAGTAVGATARQRRITSIVVVVPVVALVVLGALVSDSAWLTGVLLVAVATAAVWARGHGPRWMALGQVSFMSYYFALILRLQPQEILDFAGAAVVGVAAGFVFDHLILPERPRVVLRSGLDGFGRRLVSSMDALLDAVSWARWDHSVRKHVEFQVRQVRSHAAFAGGQLSREDWGTGVPPERAVALRLRLFDTELALMSLVSAARDLAGVTVSLEVRARLAGRIQLLQAHLAAMALAPASGERPAEHLTPWADEEPPAAWPRAARLLTQSVDELHWAAQGLRTAALAALDPTLPYDVPLSAAEREEAKAEIDDTTSVPVVHDTDDRPVPAGRRLRPPARRAVQAATASALSLGVGWLVSSTHQYWATLSAYQVLGETDGDTFVKGARRVAGTVAGAIVGFAVAISDIGVPGVIIPLLVVAIFGSVYNRQVSPAVSTLWTTMIFALLYEYLGKLTALALEQRVLETLLGAVLALGVAFFLLPTHTRTVLDKDVVALAEDVDAIVAACMDRLAGGSSAALPALRQRLLTASEHVRRIGATAAPLRWAEGALGPEGIEGRLTAVWALTSHSRRLVRATEHAVRAGVGPEDQDWHALGRATTQNVTALRTALAGELPGAVVSDAAGFETTGADSETRAADDVLRELARVNQTVLALLETISPGAVDQDTVTPHERTDG